MKAAGLTKNRKLPSRLVCEQDGDPPRDKVSWSCGHSTAATRNASQEFSRQPWRSAMKAKVNPPPDTHRGNNGLSWNFCKPPVLNHHRSGLDTAFRLPIGHHTRFPWPCRAQLLYASPGARKNRTFLRLGSTYPNTCPNLRMSYNIRARTPASTDR